MSKNVLELKTIKSKTDPGFSWKEEHTVDGESVVLNCKLTFYRQCSAVALDVRSSNGNYDYRRDYIAIDGSQDMRVRRYLEKEAKSTGLSVIVAWALNGTDERVISHLKDIAKAVGSPVTLRPGFIPQCEHWISNPITSEGDVRPLCNKCGTPYKQQSCVYVTDSLLPFSGM